MIPKVTVDSLIITRGNEVVLVKRKFEPFAGRYALPGGFVEYGEKVEEACVREAKEETGLKVKIEKLIGVYSDPKRDPRGHVVSIVFLCRPVGGKLKEKTSETKDVKVFKKEELKNLKLAFDHRKILRDAKLM